MKRMVLILVAAALGIGGIGLAGCGSSGRFGRSASQQDGPYAGGDGAFGEDPANPGEHSGERFRAAILASAATTQPSAVSAASH